MKTEKRYPSFAVLPVADRNIGDWAAVSLLWKPSLDRTSSRNIKYGLQNTDEIIFPVMHALGFCRNSEESLYTQPSRFQI